MNSFSKVKEALTSTDKGLKDTSGQLDTLAKTLGKGAEALNNSAESMKSVLDMLKQNDPAVLNKNINSVLEESAITKGNIENLKEEVEKLKSQQEKNQELLERLVKRKGILF